MVVPNVTSRRIFGRTAEAALLNDARRALASRRGCVVLLAGEAGIGKTRLLDEFRAGIAGGRAPLKASAECLEDAPRPFGPFRDLLDEIVRALPHTIDGATPLIARTLAALVPDTLAEMTGVRPALEPLEKAELFAGVCRYVTSVAEKRAIVLAIEDLHWADSASLELLCHLASRVARTRAMLVGTYRDDDLQPGRPLFAALARLEREPAVRRATLDALCSRDLRALIDDALGSQYTLSQQSIRDVVAGCDGNPFFAEEMLKRAIEREHTGIASRLPISIRALTLERLGALNAGDRSTLEYAAVLGPRFDAATLCSVAGLPRGDVLAALTELRERNIVVQSAETNGQFAFRHALTRQTIYEELLPHRVRAMHAGIVGSLERGASCDLDALAYHAWCAGSAEKTLEYSERAGDAALAVGAAEQAAAYFERALESVREDDDRVRLLEKHGEACLQQSDFRRATQAYMEAFAIFDRRREFDDAARVLCRAAAELANGGAVREAVAELERFASKRERRLGREAADHLHSSAARIATAAGDFTRARTLLAKVADPKRLPGFTHQVYWLARLFCSEAEFDVRDWSRSATALERGNAKTYPLMRSQMLHSIAATSLTFAENDRGERAADAAIAIDEERGFARPLAYANAVKACILSVRGRLRDARECIEAALAEPDLFVARLEIALGAAPAAIALGEETLARACLSTETGAAIRKAGMEAAGALFDGTRAMALFAFGGKAEGRRLLDACIDAPPHPFAVVYFWPFAASYAGREQLQRLRAACAADAGRRRSRIHRACAALLDAAIATRNGQPADRAAERSAELYGECGWPLHRARALELAGRTTDALQLFRASGASGDVRRVEMQAPHGLARRAPERLSRRERQVAALVARGMTNRRIGDELCVTEKTIEKYVTAIYAKLGFSSRTQLAAHVARSEVFAK